MFSVLALGEFIDDEGIDIALGAFSELYFNVTNKHQKKMEMMLITKGEKLDAIQQKIKNYQIDSKVELVDWSNQDKIESSYRNGSVMLLPSKDNFSKLVSESFSFGLPVICYENNHIEDIVDQTCGMLIPEDNTGESIIKFSNLLRILYFDPEAQKILKRGAQNKYAQALSWGTENQQSSKKLVAQ